MFEFSESDKILVTGANGFVGSHVVKTLLDKGATVKGTVRSVKAQEKMNVALFPEFQNTFEAVVIPDMTVLGAFHDALKDVTHIVHCASPLPLAHQENLEADLLQPSIQGVRNLFESAMRQKTIKKIVLTSSISTMMDMSKVKNGIKITDQDWNPITYEEAVELTKIHTSTTSSRIRQQYAVYAAAKTLSERYAWSFVDSEKVTDCFDLTTIHPVYIFGPSLFPGPLSGTNREFWEGLTTRPLIRSKSAGWIDVRDVAEAHVEALLQQRSNGKRVIAFGEQLTNSTIIDIARETFPEVIPPINEEQIQRDHIWNNIEANDLSSVLGLQCRTMQQSVTDYVNRVMASQ